MDNFNTFAPSDIISNTRALIEHIENNDTVTALYMLPLSDPKMFNSQALWVAAVNNNAVLVDALIPVSDPSNPHCKALNVAASDGHEHIVEMLIPATKDIGILTDAFGDALFHHKLPCAQLLYTVCEPEIALDKLLSSVHSEEGRNRILDSFSQLQRSRILEHIDDTLVLRGRRM